MYHAVQQELLQKQVRVEKASTPKALSMQSSSNDFMYEDDNNDFEEDDSFTIESLDRLQRREKMLSTACQVRFLCKLHFHHNLKPALKYDRRPLLQTTPLLALKNGSLHSRGT